MSLLLLNELTRSGYRIFTVPEAKEVVTRLGLKSRSTAHYLKQLLQDGLIRNLYRGVYAISDNILSGPPLHKYEIAMHLAKGGAIACWSAMAFHGLTDQVLTRVYVMSPYALKARHYFTYHIDGYEYVLIRVHQKHFWGTEKKSEDAVRFLVTDIERTLLDGLMRPQYFGGFREVLHAFEEAQDIIDINKLVEYAMRCPVSARKRLGWVLSRLNLIGLGDLVIPETAYFDKLDPVGPRRGKLNKTWMVMENF